MILLYGLCMLLAVVTYVSTARFARRRRIIALIVLIGLGGAISYWIVIIGDKPLPGDHLPSSPPSATAAASASL